MSDSVNDLRSLAEHWRNIGWPEDSRALTAVVSAADEIATLRASLARAEAQRDDSVRDTEIIVDTSAPGVTVTLPTVDPPRFVLLREDEHAKLVERAERAEEERDALRAMMPRECEIAAIEGLATWNAPAAKAAARVAMEFVSRIDAHRRRAHAARPAPVSDGGQCSACDGNGGLRGRGWSTGCAHCNGTGRAGKGGE